MKTNKSLHAIALIAMLIIGASMLSAQQAKNVVLANFVSTEQLYNISSFPYNTPDFPLADIWGWTYNGNEYALVCLGSKSVSGSGLVMVKVTDPNNVQIIKTIKRGSPDGLPSQNGPRDVRVFGNYAYVSQDNNLNYYVNLVTALDPSNLGNPFAGVTDFITADTTRIHNLHINTTNGLLFLSDLTTNHFIPVYDINSVSPVFKGNISEPAGGRSHDLTATTNRVYDASNVKGLTITDYTYSGGIFTPGTQRNHFYNARRGKSPNDFSLPKLDPVAHDATISTNGNYLYSTEERGGGDSPSDRQLAAYLKVWDIDSLDIPPTNGYRYPIRKVYQVKETSAPGSFNTSTFDSLLAGEFANSIHNVLIRNEGGSDIAYISYYTKGLRILDVANPLSPTELGYYDTPAVTGYVYPVYNGSWGVYPYFSSGTIVVSDMRGLYVFRRASECGGTITTNVTWSGAIFITTNVTVNSGATLTISPGTTVAFANGTGLTVNGNLIAVSDDPNKRISFTSNSVPLTAGSWNGITINASANASTLRRCDVKYAADGIDILYTGNTNNVTIDKCKITNNSADGIFVGGNNYSSATAHPVISNNTISNNGGGMEIADYAKPTITGNRIENNTSWGLFADTNCNAKIEYNLISNNGGRGLWCILSSSAEVHRNTIKSNSINGITCASNSNLLAKEMGVAGDTTKGRNEITGNSGVGIYASSCSPNFGLDLSGQYGNNWIHDNTGYEAQQTGSGYQINASRCYWSGQQSNVSGTVYTTPALSSAPANPPAGWGRSTNDDPTLRIGTPPANIATLIPEDIQNTMAASTIMAKTAATNTATTNWTADLQAAIALGLTTGDWSAASALITALHRELQDARVPEVDFTLVNTYANDLAVAAFIRKMLALALMEKELTTNNISTALTKLNTFAVSNPENAAEFLLNAGAIYLYRQNDPAAAQNVLAQLQTLARNGDVVAADHVEAFDLILRRHQRLRANNAGALPKPDMASLAATVLTANLALAQNYPNPFNPATAIRFHLNERQKIRLLIFDLNGKLVQTLFDGELVSGAQTILWDGRDQQGRNVASGVYFYELTAGNQIERKKMALVR